MNRCLVRILLLILIHAATANAQPGIPPLTPAAQPPPVDRTAVDDPVVVGRMEHLGWSLTGPKAKHYIFGGLAVADYVWQGKRRIVTLQEQTELPQPDDNYLYYRELRDGNWWAFRKKPWPDKTYSVWFRSADAPPGTKWQRLQMAKLQMTGQ